MGEQLTTAQQILENPQRSKGREGRKATKTNKLTRSMSRTYAKNNRREIFMQTGTMTKLLLLVSADVVINR